MILKQLFESENETMRLWHGGRGLEFSYQEMLAHKKGRWEHGPGLYLTNHYEIAAKYAKGGGKIYLVTINKGTDIANVNVSIEDAIEFVKKYAIKRYQKKIIEDLQNSLNRQGFLWISNVGNLCFNYNALTPENTINLRKFFVEHGVDYEIVKHFGGRNDSTVVVVYNPKIIKSVKVKKSSETTMDDRTNSTEIT